MITTDGRATTAKAEETGPLYPGLQRFEFGNLDSLCLSRGSKLELRAAESSGLMTHVKGVGHTRYSVLPLPVVVWFSARVIFYSNKFSAFSWNALNSIHFTITPFKLLGG